MKVAAIIQAWLGSKRLPRKILKPLGNKTALGWCITRCSLARHVDEVIVASGHKDKNSEISDETRRYDMVNGKPVIASYYSGDQKDIIGRVLSTARYHKVDLIVEITSDCSMVDPKHIDILIEKYLEGKHHYVSNCEIRSWPDGLDIQVYEPKVLEEVYEGVNSKLHHCGYNIHNLKDHFGFQTYNWHAKDYIFQGYDWPDLRLTLDTEADYKMLSTLFEGIEKDDFDVLNIVDHLRFRPGWISNKHIKAKDPKEG